MPTFARLLAALLLWITSTMGWELPAGPAPALRIIPEEAFLATAFPDVPWEDLGSALPLRAFYDSRRDTIVLPARAAALSAETLEALVHELTHALQARQGRMPDPADRSWAGCEARPALKEEAWAVEDRWRQAAGHPPEALPFEYRLARLACEER